MLQIFTFTFSFTRLLAFFTDHIVTNRCQMTEEAIQIIQNQFKQLFIFKQLLILTIKL